jgi:hypothetical protein
MRLKLILGLFAALFLFVVYFFISHAYVFMRLTSVLGFMALVFALMVAVFFAGRIK